ncbi:hypothetical protein TCDM_03412 [Trypanosoma cruzi Dm28c]|uniref:Uncharacterized protein n=1 Tax=Trypanosoma cruzi Dm28c TaxID=1416333 RepID=V5BJE1_TRYCR|nr:hypothetical protein TCDM_03412 [Trypanosoma cruzi Dm28c]
MKERSAELRFHPAMLAMLMMMVMIGFALGYHHGVKAWEKDFVNKYEQSHGRELHAGSMLGVCSDELFLLSNNVSSKNQTIHAVQNENAGIEQEMKKLSQEFKSVTDLVDKCRAEITIIGEEGSRRDGDPHLELKAIENELRVLRELLSNLTEGEGMHRVHIHGLLGSMREKHKHFCGRLPGCTLLSDESILRRWKEVLYNSSQRRMLKEADRMRRMKWRYDKQTPQERESIYFSEREEGGKAPTYFGRTGNSSLLLAQGQMSQVVVSTVLERVLLLQRFALCAYRTNNPNITFPSIFQWSASSENTVADLRDLVETPLLTFCMDCTEVEITSDIAQLCLKAPEGENGYGKRDFWVMRSMLLPHSGVVHDAKNFYTAHALTNRKVLAVVAHNSVRDCLAHFDDPRGDHFLYLLANFPEGRTRFENHVSNNTLHQCSPTAAQLARRITQVLEEGKLDGVNSSFDAVYMSVSSEIWKELRGLEKELPWWGMALFRQGEIASAHDELVDLTIIGRAHGILVSPFLAPSQYVLESFLLSHGLQPMGRVWFF